MRLISILSVLLLPLMAGAQVYALSAVDTPPRFSREAETRPAFSDDISRRNEEQHFYRKLKFPAVCRAAQLFEEYHISYVIDETGRVVLDSIFSTPHGNDYPAGKQFATGRDTLTVTAFPASHGGFMFSADSTACRAKTRENLEEIVESIPRYEPAIWEGRPVSVLKKIVVVYRYAYWRL